MVIDVQEKYFEKPNQPLKNSFVKNVEELVKNAKLNNVDVVFLEMGATPTLRSITKVFKNPKIIKKQSYSALNAMLSSMEMNHDEYHLCGLYSDICIHATAKDLKKKGHDVVIHNRAVIESDRVLGYYENLDVYVTSSLKIRN